MRREARLNKKHGPGYFMLTTDQQGADPKADLVQEPTGVPLSDGGGRQSDDGSMPAGPLTGDARLALIEEVYGRLIQGTETFEANDVGLNLAYLLGAIANGNDVVWRSRSEFVRLVRREFPRQHPVWRFIRFDDEE